MEALEKEVGDLQETLRRASSWTARDPDKRGMKEAEVLR
jgi:hypothetical protein